MSNDTRVPEGVPTGGQFAHATRNESAVTLETVPAERQTRAEHHSFIAGLTEGQEVVLIRDGRENTLTVQRTITGSDGNGFGSWDHANVKVGYGPGRFNTEVTAAGLESGYYALRLPEETVA